MSFFEQKSHKIIAAELEIPLGTVKSRIRTTLNKCISIYHEHISTKNELIFGYSSALEEASHFLYQCIFI